MRSLSLIAQRTWLHANWPIGVLFLLVNGMMAVNVALHNPLVGYDIDHHIQYVLALSEGRLPNPQDSEEFFSPPLPYILPAFLVSVAEVSPWRAVKDAQWFNFLLSLGLTYNLLKISAALQPPGKGLKIAALALLGMLPVYYKSFVQLRGEPFVAFFVVCAVAQVLTMFSRQPFSARRLGWDAVCLGITLGLLALSRQWGVLLFPALAIFAGLFALKIRRMAPVWVVLASFGVAFIVSGWFYLHLHRQYGSFTTFNRQPAPFSLANQPASFYFDLGLEKLFRDPLRPMLSNQLWPVLYADTWGDYWGYFLFVFKDLRSERRGDGVLYLTGEQVEQTLAETPLPEWLETNRFEMSAYLGRVNLVSLFPSALLLAGVVYGLSCLLQFMRQEKPTPFTSANMLFALVVFVSFTGYLWFLIRYPILDKGGNNIKATYILHIYPFLAILGGSFLQSLVKRWRFAAWVIGAALGLVFIHNLPALFTRYPMLSTRLIQLFFSG
jgi:hypothetical protein